MSSEHGGRAQRLVGRLRNIKNILAEEELYGLAADLQNIASEIERLVSLFRLCTHCHQEHQVPMTESGICNFYACPHCGKRNDVWLKWEPSLQDHAPAASPASHRSPPA